MDILPLVLTEEMALEIPKVYLHRLAGCSTPAVKMKVGEYLADDRADARAKEIVRAAYGDTFERDRFLFDSDFMEQVGRVSDLTYSSVNNSVKTEILEDWKKTLTEVFENKFATPYIAPIEGTMIDSIIMDLSGLKEVNTAAATLASRLRSHKDLFRDGRAKRSVGTAMKRILLNEAKYRVILRGVEFLLEQRAKGHTAPVWRVL